MKNDLQDIFKRRLKGRQAKEVRFRIYCRASLGLALTFLVLLLGDIGWQGVGAFRQAQLLVDVDYSKETMESGDFLDAEIEAVASRGFTRLIPALLRDNPATIGTKETLWILANAEADQYLKGKPNRLTPAEKATMDKLRAEKKADLFFNYRFFTSGDSKLPEMAGIYAAAMGSIYVIFLTTLFSFPVGVLTALYLEEFAPDNRLTQLIEINISNLAAIPSIIFGLLGLAIFINFFGVPRSSALAGGLTLALMNLPVIIVSTRAVIRAVPESIKHAALSLGATPWQVAMDHTLPYSLPGILTGAIIGLARAMGETAPLLIIGMMAYIPDAPSDFLGPATVMPAQIYTWSSDSVRAFTERTAAGILVLIAILLSMNLIAIWMRNRYERRW